MLPSINVGQGNPNPASSLRTGEGGPRFSKPTIMSVCIYYEAASPGRATGVIFGPTLMVYGGSAWPSKAAVPPHVTSDMHLKDCRLHLSRQAPHLDAPPPSHARASAGHSGLLTYAPTTTRAYAYTVCIELLRTPPPPPPSQRLRVREARRAASAGWVLQGMVTNQDSKGLKTC